MGKFNQELEKAGILLAAEGLQPSSKGARVGLLGKQAHGDRRTLRRGQGADRGLLAVAGEVEGRSDRMGEALPESDAGGLREIEIRQVYETEDFGPLLRPSGGRGWSKCARGAPRSPEPRTTRNAIPDDPRRAHDEIHAATTLCRLAQGPNIIGRLSACVLLVPGSYSGGQLSGGPRGCRAAVSDPGSSRPDGRPLARPIEEPADRERARRQGRGRVHGDVDSLLRRRARDLVDVNVFLHNPRFAAAPTH